MSASDAPTMFTIDSNTLAEQYRTKFQDEAHRAVLLENALQVMGQKNTELEKQVKALQEQLEILSNSEEPEPSPHDSGDMEAVSGPHADSSPSD